MKYSLRFALAGAAIGIVLTLVIYVFQNQMSVVTFPFNQEQAIVSSSPISRTYSPVVRRSTPVSRTYSPVVGYSLPVVEKNKEQSNEPFFVNYNRFGYDGSIIFSFIKNIKREKIDEAKSNFLNIKNEEVKFFIIEQLSINIFNDLGNDIKNDVYGVMLEIFLDVLTKEISPISNEMYLDAFQSVIKSLEANGDFSKAEQGFAKFDNMLNSFQYEQEEIRNVEKPKQENEIGILFIGSLITTSFGAIGFIMSALLGPILKKFGESLSSNDDS
ncbi:MAG: hypothetical protein D3925_00105 [Candidatus Electrothrix sp. AR5]|nr:hypothetical protein [Candidatus Electrothrix sp. AR5]